MIKRFTLFTPIENEKKKAAANNHFHCWIMLITFLYNQLVNCAFFVWPTDQNPKLFSLKSYTYHFRLFTLIFILFHIWIWILCFVNIFGLLWLLLQINAHVYVHPYPNIPIEFWVVHFAFAEASFINTTVEAHHWCVTT